MRNYKDLRVGMTLPEAVVVIVIIVGLLIYLAGEVGHGTVQVRAAQTKALSNARQIAMACKLYAGDYDGHFPPCVRDANGTVSPMTPSTSNAAFVPLFPEYILAEAIFYVPSDGFYCSQSPDFGKPAGQILGPGKNHWGYVTNLTEKSDPRFPLIADGAITGGTSYSTDERAAGGAWKGKKAIVVRVDMSGSIDGLDRQTLTIPGPDGVSDLLQGNQKGWLGPNNLFINPIPKPQGE